MDFERCRIYRTIRSSKAYWSLLDRFVVNIMGSYLMLVSTINMVDSNTEPYE